MIIHNFPQYSIEWWSARRGIPTASAFKRILSPGGKLSKSADDYACELIADKYTDIPTDYSDYMSKEMLNGLNFEDEARSFYCMTENADLKPVGFATTDDGRFGCSPDSGVGEDGGLEIKCPMAKTHIGYLIEGGLPADYKPQVHGQLVVTGWKWVDFVSYCRGLPPLKVRVVRDEYTELLASALEQFHQRYLEIDNIIKGLRND